MNKIEVKVLNPDVVEESQKMMVCAARLTQRGHNINSMDDFLELYDKEYTDGTVKGSLKVITAVIPNADANKLRQMGDQLRDKAENVVAVLLTVNLKCECCTA